MTTEPEALEQAKEQYFNSGWEAARREVLAMGKLKGDSAAVEWIRAHPAVRPEGEAEAKSVPIGPHLVAWQSFSCDIGDEERA